MIYDVLKKRAVALVIAIFAGAPLAQALSFGFKRPGEETVRTATQAEIEKSAAVFSPPQKQEVQEPTEQDQKTNAQTIAKGLALVSALNALLEKRNTVIGSRSIDTEALKATLNAAANVLTHIKPVPLEKNISKEEEKKMSAEERDQIERLDLLRVVQNELGTSLRGELKTFATLYSKLSDKTKQSLKMAQIVIPNFKASVRDIIKSGTYNREIMSTLNAAAPTVAALASELRGEGYEASAKLVDKSLTQLTNKISTMLNPE